jgi:methionine-rich copper-binding protein CopC
LRFPSALLAVGVVCALTTSVAAHAFLDHATPAVGSTVGAVSTLELNFTQNIVGSLSNVRVVAASGSAVPVSRPTVSGSTMRVQLGRALAPGVYVVRWHVVSVDTHPTSGSFKFTVAP